MSKRVWDEAVARDILAPLAVLDGAALPMLHALQDAFGYVDPAAAPVIADMLNLSRAEVHGVVTFYHDFRSAPAGRRIVKICRAEACQANGVEALLAELFARQGLSPDGAGDAALTFETVYCLGNCALGPNALVDGELVARLDADRLAALCAGAAIEDAQISAGQAK